MGQVQAEYAGRARAGAAAAGRRDNFLWVDQSGREVWGNTVPQALGVRVDHRGQPRQRTVTHASVPELASEPVTPPDMDVRPVVLVCDGTGPGHVPKPGERFCPECGRARP